MIKIINSVFLFILLLFIHYYSCKIIIDDFTIVSKSISVTVPNYPSFPLFNSSFIQGSSSHIIGGERDLGIGVSYGMDGVSFDLGVASGTFFCDTPITGYSKVLLQYDGMDASINLNPSGLGGINLYNFGQLIEYTIAVDLSANVTINIYSGSNTNYCSITQFIQGTGYYVLQTLEIPYSDFTFYGLGCSFSNVGAIELIIEMIPSVDIVMSEFNIITSSSNINHYI